VITEPVRLGLADGDAEGDGLGDVDVLEFELFAG
jgi:hypothetical protein